MNLRDVGMVQSGEHLRFTAQPGQPITIPRQMIGQ